VAAGPPEEIVRHPESYTGRYLAPYLAGREVEAAGSAGDSRRPES
jgi:hypothetical protein